MNRKKSVPTPGGTTKKPMTRASKARFEQGVMLEYGHPPVEGGGRTVMVNPNRRSSQETILAFQYPLGATDAEKVAMVETRIRELWCDLNQSIAQQVDSLRRLREDFLQSEKRLAAALGMIRAFQVIPGQDGDFDDNIPF